MNEFNARMVDMLPWFAIGASVFCVYVVVGVYFLMIKGDDNGH